TIVTTCNHTSAFGAAGRRWIYSVILAFSPYGTPFLRKYPPRKFVVVTSIEPPSFSAAEGGGPPRWPRPPPPASTGPASFPICARTGPAPAPGGRIQRARDSPCHVFASAAGNAPNSSRRVC